MYKAIILAIIGAAASADPKSITTLIAPLAVVHENVPQGYPAISQTHNDLTPSASNIANTPSLSTPQIPKSTPIATKAFPIIASKAAPIVAAPALTKAPLVAGPLVVKSAPLGLASSPAASRAALLAGPSMPAAYYNSLMSPYVLYPYVASPYLSGANYI